MLEVLAFVLLTQIWDGFTHEAPANQVELPTYAQTE